MGISIDAITIRAFLSKISLQTDGDGYERRYGHFLLEHFPNCEKFWRIFIAPLTQRMNGYPHGATSNIGFRSSISSELEDICIAHYSLFINLVYAHLHLETRMQSSLEDIYVHLGSACDLVETTLEKWYLILLKCRELKSRVLQELSKDEFLAIAGNWYDKNYANLYSIYFSKGKSPPLRLIDSSDTLQEYFGKGNDARSNYVSCSRPIREFRNVIVHNPLIANIITRDDNTRIPKPSKIQDYKSWRQVANAANDATKINRDFVEPYQQVSDDINSLEAAINNLWDKMISDFEEEFYSTDRTVLRDMYNVVLSSSGFVAGFSDIPIAPLANSDRITTASGIFNEGSAEYRPKPDKSDDEIDPSLLGD